jgi:hypothetical protein
MATRAPHHLLAVLRPRTAPAPGMDQLELRRAPVIAGRHPPVQALHVVPVTLRRQAALADRHDRAALRRGAHRACRTRGAGDQAGGEDQGERERANRRQPRRRCQTRPLVPPHRSPELEIFPRPRREPGSRSKQRLRRPSPSNRDANREINQTSSLNFRPSRVRRRGRWRPHDADLDSQAKPDPGPTCGPRPAPAGGAVGPAWAGGRRRPQFGR